ncbi:SIMPL domain-containing protein [Arthrobacter sp. AB6]|uniref:SIMPL domain-containing protein n=1 Tax=Arthrobacter sp. AB6 TaxID=2962570 RepID=UPI00288223FF|nr:SIMPL domain-containing protein [Arthrobacter sp. AB6]MDT0194734.1 SIMPL domain-containing protein [Arthrobacter sp. AB6]
MAADSGSGGGARDGIGIPGTVTVTGTGSADAAPDLMVVSIGVECRAESVEAAYSRAGASSEAAASAFRRHGVEDADIRTAALNVRADMTWREGEGQRVTGYVAASTLTIRLRAPGSASAAISEAVGAGGNDVRLNGLELTFSDDAAVRARAREAAWLDAASTARQYAQLASARLGRVLSVVDNVPVQGPVPLARMQRAASVEQVAVEPGDSTVAAAITVVWELQDLP